MDYIELLEHSFNMEKETDINAQDSRLEYLADHVFDFTTYDSEMSGVLAKYAVQVCQALTYKATHDYIKSPENYRWYLIMCNMPFFRGRLDWGTSIRGAWWSHDEQQLSSCGIWSENQQITSMHFNAEEWQRFIQAVIKFAGPEMI